MVHYYSEFRMPNLFRERESNADLPQMGPIAAVIVAVNCNGTVALDIALPPYVDQGRPGPSGHEGRDLVEFSETPKPGCWTWPPRA